MGGGPSLHLSPCDSGALRCVVSDLRLRDKDWRKLSKAFNKIDSDGTGSVSLLEVFRFVGVQPTSFGATALFALRKAPEAKSVGLVEFVAGIFNFCTYNRDELVRWTFQIATSTDYLYVNDLTALVRSVHGGVLDSRTKKALDSAVQTAGDTGLRADELVLRARESPALLAPACVLQEAVRNVIIGPSYWRTRTDKRLDDGVDYVERLRLIEQEFFRVPPPPDSDDDSGDEVSLPAAGVTWSPDMTVTNEGGVVVLANHASMRSRAGTLRSSSGSSGSESARSSPGGSSFNSFNSSPSRVRPGYASDEDPSKTQTTWRPKRSKGERPSIKPGRATYSKSINAKKYAWFRETQGRGKREASVRGSVAACVAAAA
ncbi:hypothetical protein M885DRAFT_469805 [Pelagophyceae sp. CCMP2097]|nr:hypothetical protein M885DRAFT_469805 [Pelagophyceae sp. CCMP2097]